MNCKKQLLVLPFSLLVAFIGFSQNSLQLNINGLKSAKGNICYAIYKNEQSFLKFEEVFKSGAEKAMTGINSIQVNDVPNGNYAIAIFHDENGNKILDTNMFGVPKEPVAFSIGKMRTFGPPKFDECSFDVIGDIEMNIGFD